MAGKGEFGEHFLSREQQHRVGSAMRNTTVIIIINIIIIVNIDRAGSSFV